LSILSFTDREREREREREGGREESSCRLARVQRGRERGLISMVIAGIGREMQLSGEKGECGGGGGAQFIINSLD